MKRPVNNRKPRATRKKTESKTADPGAKGKKEDLRNKERAPKDKLRNLNEEKADIIDDYRKEVEIVYDSMIFDKEAFEAEHAGKRGVRPNWHYLEIALNILENLYIEYYSDTSYNK